MGLTKFQSTRIVGVKAPDGAKIEVVYVPTVSATFELRVDGVRVDIDFSVENALDALDAMVQEHTPDTSTQTGEVPPVAVEAGNTDDAKKKNTRSE